jgi:hypothetical protein
LTNSTNILSVAYEKEVCQDDQELRPGGF